MTKLLDVEGIGDVYAQRLKKGGIRSLEDLLKKGATPTGRKTIAEKTGIGDHLILEWINRADLFRIKGVGEEYSDLLEAAGVDTVVELAQRVPSHLHQKFVETNSKRKIVRKLPSESQVADWISQAKRLPRVVTY